MIKIKVLYKAPRGTVDILPNETKLWQYVKDVAIKTCEKFGFGEIIIPTFETKELFMRSTAESSFIVQKEMFSFKDLKNREFFLRPEGTLPVARAILEHGFLNKTLPVKIFYIINSFRNERPQEGRYKEFYQFGVELFGSKEPVSEFEVISLAEMFFKKIGISNLKLEINSIGCSKCRKIFVEKLKDFFNKHSNEMCEDCKRRLKTNPLRILDCKNLNCKKISKNSPIILEFICKECLKHFEDVLKLLNFNEIKYEINNSLVRGLDYYTRTVFEFTTENLGAQNTVCGGGRYDNLLETLGANPTPALGFGVGLNRLILLIKKEKEALMQEKCDIYIGSLNEEANLKISKITKNLRKQNLIVQTDLLKRTVKAQMKYANKLNSLFSCIIGEDELKNNKVSVKNMFSKETFNISLNNFEDEFLNIFKKS